MSNFWMRNNLWKHEVDTVTNVYPDAVWVDAKDGGEYTRAWHLTIEPIPNDGQLQMVLADLDAGKSVAIGEKGKVGHSQVCPTEKHAAFMPALHLSQEKFYVSLTYPSSSQGKTWSNHPKVRLIIPDIARQYPLHPHLFWHPSGRDAWACPVSPQDNIWKWKHGATVAYLDQVAIWLLKTRVWIATGGGLAGLGKWIGPVASHRPIDHLGTIAPTDPCWCGQGRSYGQCHLKVEIDWAIRERILGKN